MPSNKNPALRVERFLWCAFAGQRSLTAPRRGQTPTENTGCTLYFAVSLAGPRTHILTCSPSVGVNTQQKDTGGESSRTPGLLHSLTSVACWGRTRTNTKENTQAMCFFVALRCRPRDLLFQALSPPAAEEPQPTAHNARAEADHVIT